MSFDKLLIMGLLIVLPFDATDFLHFKIGTFSVNLADIIILVALITVVLKQLANRTSIKMTPDLFLFLLLAFCTSLINFAWLNASGPDLKISLNYLEYLALFYIFSQVIRDETLLKRILSLFLAVVTCVAVLTILMSLGFELPGLERKTRFSLWVFRIGVVGLEEQFAPFSLLLIGAFSLLLEKTIITSRWLRLVLAMLFFLAAVVTGSRGLYVSLIGLIVVWVYCIKFPRLTGEKRLIAFVGLILGIGICMGLFVPFFGILEKMRPKTVDQRVANFLLAISFASSDILSFLFGYGKGEYLSVTNIAAHNFLLDILVSKGVFTLISVISLYAVIIYRLAQVPGGPQTTTGQMKASLMLGFLGMVIVGLFDVITSSIIFWTYLAIAYTFTLIPRKKTTPFTPANTSRSLRVKYDPIR